jgi:CBS domain-containing protein
MYLQEILNKKGSQVFLIAPQATLEEAVERLVKHNVGSLLVWQDELGSTGVVGIITERDILRAVASHRGRLETLRVFDVMTTHLVTVSPHHSIEQAMGLMTEHRVRHLPVFANGGVCGMISIGDVVKAHHDFLEQENHYMRSYIHGEGGERATV